MKENKIRINLKPEFLYYSVDLINLIKIRLHGFFKFTPCDIDYAATLSYIKIISAGYSSFFTFSFNINPFYII
jgi:hypothetical protein